MHTQRTIKLTALVLGASLVLAACQTTDPYTGEQKTSNTTKGAAIGAGVGVAIGLLTGDSSS